MINDQKVNTYFIRIIDFLDLLNLIAHHVTGCVRQVSTRHQSLSPSHLSCSLTHTTWSWTQSNKWQGLIWIMGCTINLGIWLLARPSCWQSCLQIFLRVHFSAPLTALCIIMTLCLHLYTGLQIRKHYSKSGSPLLPGSQGGVATHFLPRLGGSWITFND